MIAGDYTVRRAGDLLIVTAAPVNNSVLASVPSSRWNPAVRGWTYPATPGAARGLVAVLGQHELLVQLAGPDAAPREDPLPHEYALFPPWRHQVRATHWLADRPAALLQYGMGTGKTRAALDAARIVGAKRILVACPLAAVPVWKQQAELHAPGHFAVLSSNQGSVLQRCKRAVGALATAGDRPLIVVVNYDALWRDQFNAVTLKTKWDVVIFDEIHRIKSPGSRVSRFAARLIGNSKQRWGLSGTPLAHSPMDAYGIFRTLDNGIFGTNYHRFQARYAVMGGFGNYQVLRYVNVDEFRALYYSITLAQDRDILDLPEAHHVEIPITLPDAAKAIYRSIRDDFVADLGNGKIISAGHALTRLLRLQQVTSGSAPCDDEQPAPGTRSVEIHTAKEDALAEMLGDLDPTEPAVVFARFTADLERAHRAAKAAGRASLELSGRRKELAAWQGRTDGSVLIAQIQSGSEGIDLTRAAHCVYFSVPLALAQYEQSLARVHRPGQARPVTYYHLQATGTIDKYIYRLLRQRREVLDAVLEQGIQEE